MRRDLGFGADDPEAPTGVRILVSAASLRALHRVARHVVRRVLFPCIPRCANNARTDSLSALDLSRSQYPARADPVHGLWPAQAAASRPSAASDVRDPPSGPAALVPCLLLNRRENVTVTFSCGSAGPVVNVNLRRYHRRGSDDAIREGRPWRNRGSCASEWSS